MVKKLVLESGDAQLLSQQAAMQEVVVGLEKEVAPFKDALDASLTEYNAAIQALEDATDAFQIKEAAYFAALATYNNMSVELQKVIAAIPDIIDQTSPISIVSAAALRLGLLDETSPN